MRNTWSAFLSIIFINSPPSPPNNLNKITKIHIMYIPTYQKWKIWTFFLLCQCLIPPICIIQHKQTHLLINPSNHEAYMFTIWYVSLIIIISLFLKLKACECTHIYFILHTYLLNAFHNIIKVIKKYKHMICDDILLFFFRNNITIFIPLYFCGSYCFNTERDLLKGIFDVPNFVFVPTDNN